MVSGKDEKIVYVFGNPHLPDDSFAYAVSSHLDCELHFCRSPEELLEAEGEEIIILDVVVGAKKPLLITDVDQLKVHPLVSLHDFDVAFFLHLLKEIGMLKTIKIIGIPQKGDAESIAKTVQSML